MELNYILCWIAGAGAALGLLGEAGSPRAGRAARMAPHLLVLAVLALSLAIVPRHAGALAGATFAVLVVAPGVLAAVLHRALEAQRYGRAAALLEALRRLRPGRDDGADAGVLRALAAAQAGRPAEALARLRGGGLPERVLRARLHGDWPEVRSLLAAEIGLRGSLADAALVMAWLRSLGETGDPEAMVAEASRLGASDPTAAVVLAQPTARLQLLALAGRSRGVEALLHGPLRRLPRDAARAWLGTALQAEGDPRRAAAVLEAAADTRDALVRQVVTGRLERPMPPARVGPAARTVLDAMEAEALSPRPAAPALRPAVATWSLAALLGGVFGLEVLVGGSTDVETLLRLGALIPGEVLEGAWWRVLTAPLLHAGAVHLAMNVAGLVVLGPMVERSIGRWRFLAVCVASGLASMGAVVGLATVGYLRDQVLVGASGIVMGLVGATAASLLDRHLRAPSRDAARRLVLVAGVILLQSLFDLVTPQVSFTAHAGGLVAGFVVAGAFALLSRRPPSDR